MMQRTIASALTVLVLFCLSSGFANAQVASQKASGSPSDRMLFEQAQQALKKSNYIEAQTLLMSLINTHPDSDYVPLAKLSIADSWYIGTSSHFSHIGQKWQKPKVESTPSINPRDNC
jgi:outer membrane protein assembly factor BamD (BamD/ComL family)